MNNLALSAPVTAIIPTISGNVLAGLGIMLNVQTLWVHSLPTLKNGIFADKDRQRWLAIICFCGQITYIVASGYQAVLSGTEQTIITNTVMNAFILYGLALLVHNSMIRLYVAIVQKANLNFFNKFCYVLYLLPPVVYTPYWILISKYWNTESLLVFDPLFHGVWEPIFFTSVVATEALALLSDFVLVRRVLSSQQKLAGPSTSRRTSKSTTSSQSGIGVVGRLLPLLNNVPSTTITFMAVYGCIWCTLALDIVIKCLIQTTSLPLLFDGAITLLGMTLRATANLSFGTTVKGAAATKGPPSLKAVVISGPIVTGTATEKIDGSAV